MKHTIKITYDNDHQQPVVSSKQVADDFNKKHKDVLESIRNLVAENSAAKSWFYETTYESRGKQYPMYLMNKDGFTFLVMGFTGKLANDWKIKYIQAFNDMEKHIRGEMTTEEKVLLSLQYSKEISDRVNTVEEIALETKEDVDQLKNNMVIDRSQKHQLIRAKNRTILAICGGNRRMPAYKCKELVAKIARTMWRQYWDHFDIASYEDTPAVRYEEAKDYIEQWLPDNNLRLEVARINQGDGNVG